MSFTLVKDLEVNPLFKSVLRPLTESERSNLRAQIIKDGFLSPVLFYVPRNGRSVVVDGHNRLGIWSELEQDEEVYDIGEPETEEVASLRGADDDTVVAWIIQHQAARRNDESLAAKYAIGKDWRESGKSSTQVAEEYGIADTTVRKYGAVADAVDRAEQAIPGAKDEILASEDVSASDVLDSEPEELMERVRSPEPKKWDVAAAFKKLSTHLAAASKYSGDIAHHTAPGNFPERMELALQQANLILVQWQAAELGVDVP